MKQLKAKLLAGVLTAAMVLGTFAGAAPLTARRQVMRQNLQFAQWMNQEKL